MKTQNQNGFTLIEALVGIFILSIMIFGVYGMYDYSLKMVREKGRREGALAIANQEMEYFRSIDYDDLGPYLCIPEQTSNTKTAVRNGVSYEVITDIICTKDPFDNEDHDPGKNDDTGLNDYKTARVEVRWDSTSTNNSVALVSTFAPIGIERNCGGGILKINVFDANANPVHQASVYIKNDNIGYENTVETNNGAVRIGCLAEDLNNNYEITVSKDAYSTAQTCPTGVGISNPICPKLSPDNVNPADLHLNIIEGETTEKSFSIDLLSVLNITTVTTPESPTEWTANQTPGDSPAQEMPTMAIGPGDTYYLFWQQKGGGQTRIYGQKYDSSQAAQWGPPDAEIITANNEIFPSITVSMTSGDVYVAWYRTSGGNQETYIEKIASKIESPKWYEVWWERLVPATTRQNDNQSEPQIGLEDNENFLYLTYLDNTDDANNNIYTARFKTTDGVQEWTGETRMNDDSNGNKQASHSIMVEPATDDLIAVWQDNREGDNDIYAQKIDSDGTYDDMWNGGLGNVKINEDGGEEQLNPDVDILQDGGENFLYIVWQDYRNDNFDIYMQKFNTLGEAQWGNDINITTKDITNSDQTKPTIVVNNANDAIYVAWVDERNGNPDIYLQKFNTLGVAQWEYDFRVNNDVNPGSIQDNPQILINSSDEAVLTWQDNDAGNYDIKTSIVPDPEPTNKGDVPLRIHGSKIIGKDISENDIYKFDSTFTTDANGEFKFDDINGAKLEWDAYTFEINGANYTLEHSEPPTPITISPNTVNSIILTVKSAP